MTQPSWKMAKHNEDVQCHASIKHANGNTIMHDCVVISQSRGSDKWDLLIKDEKTGIEITLNFQKKK